MSILLHWFLRYRCSVLPSHARPCSICLDSWTRFLCSIVLYNIGLYFTTGHIHRWVLFLLWKVSPIFLELFLCFSPVTYWTPTDLEAHLLASYLSVFSYCPWGSPGNNTGVSCHFLSPVGHILSELFIMTCPSCVAWLAASLRYKAPSVWKSHDPWRRP